MVISLTTLPPQLSTWFMNDPKVRHLYVFLESTLMNCQSVNYELD